MPGYLSKKRQQDWELHRVAVRADRVVSGRQPMEQLMTLEALAPLVEGELERRGVLWEGQASPPAPEIRIGRRTLRAIPCRHYLIFVHPHLRAVARRYLGLPHDEAAVERWLHNKMFGTSEEEIARWDAAADAAPSAEAQARAAPDYTRACCVCGATPVLPATDMCGPCTFGEADTMDGRW